MIKAMKAGDTFYTISPSTGDRAEVQAYLCMIDECKVLTLRTSPDRDKDDNLDNLPTCAI